MMCRTASQSKKENIQDFRGFNRTTRQYIRLDLDAWLTLHNIRKEGARRGKQNLPGPDESQPDSIYRKIESFISERALGCKKAVEEYIEEELASLHDICSIWHKQTPEIDIDALIEQRCQDLEAQAAQSLSDLDKRREEYEEATNDFKNFRERNGLSRIADYPDNKTAHWLWVPVAMIIETFLGANLLGSVSRGGIIEGWMVATVLTFVNVLVGILAGKVWCFTQYDWGLKKLFAYFFGILCVALTLLWNNIAGHVRDVYVLAEKTGALEAPDEAFANAWRTMINQPLPWESLPSAGLALIGVAVFVLTAFKSYTADDPFPGHGARHRKVEALHGRYQDALNDALDKLKAMRNNAIAAIEEIKSRYEMDQANWESALDRLQIIVNSYSSNLMQYNKDLAYLLAAYRDSNLETRTAKPPEFFNNEPKIDKAVAQPPKFTIPKPPEWGNIVAKAEKGFAQVGETYSRLRGGYQMLDRFNYEYKERTS